MNDSPFQPMRYGSRVAELLLADRLPELGAGQPNTSARPLLAALSVETLFENGPIVNDDLAQCCLAGLWLWHDFLEESHRISQEIACAEGSYWHGMMHRREADYSNAKYWFRRVGAHEVYQQLSQVPAVPAFGHGLGSLCVCRSLRSDCCRSSCRRFRRARSSAARVAVPLRPLLASGARERLIHNGRSRNKPGRGGYLADRALKIIEWPTYTAQSSSTCSASRLRATCKRRLMVPSGASNSSAISSSERPRT